MNSPIPTLQSAKTFRIFHGDGINLKRPIATIKNIPVRHLVQVPIIRSKKNACKLPPQVMKSKEL